MAKKRPPRVPGMQAAGLLVARNTGRCPDCGIRAQLGPIVDGVRIAYFRHRNTCRVVRDDDGAVVDLVDGGAIGPWAQTGADA